MQSPPTPPRPPQPPGKKAPATPAAKGPAHQGNRDGAATGNSNINDLLTIGRPTPPATAQPAESLPQPAAAAAAPVPREAGAAAGVEIVSAPPAGPAPVPAVPVARPLATPTTAAGEPGISAVELLQRASDPNLPKDGPRKRTYNFDSDVDDALHRISLLTPGPKGDKTFLINQALREFLLRHPNALTPVPEELMVRRAGRRHH